MRKQTAILLFSALTTSHGAYAQARGDVPAEKQVVAALNEQAENDLSDYLREFPPGTATGHIVPVEFISRLVCAPLPEAEKVRCHFIAHQGLLDREATATLVRSDGGWHISGE